MIRTFCGGRCACAALVCAVLNAADGRDLTVPLPAGRTALTDIGLYRVIWQSYGKAPVAMPDSWAGHFEPSTGISVAKWGRVLGREALLLHSPWRVASGLLRVEYELALPRAKPITLSFGIAMGPDVAQPNKSDGVTFACTLAAGGAKRELMRVHQTKAEWRDFAFDLSAHAGTTVVVALQVEPGPANNSAWDYSFFGDAAITAGDARPSRAETLARLTGARAYKAAAGASLAALANRPGNGVVPSNLLPCRNSVRADGSAWRFAYEGADCRVVYTYTPATGTLDDFLAWVDAGQPFRPAASGGVLAEEVDGGRLPVRGGRAAETTLSGNTLKVVWDYELAGAPLRVVWTFGIEGKALTVAAECAAPRLIGFSLGEAAAPLRRTFDVPYLAGAVAYLSVQNAFACRYLDWTFSNASQCPQGTAAYDRMTDGARNPLRERGYIAVSPDVGEVLPNIPHAPSPYLAALGPRIMLDIWSHHQHSFAGDAERLRELADNGVDHLAIIQHVWQRYGYDVKLPDHLPANPRYGGEECLQIFGRAAKECGCIWALHENNIDLYPDAPSYDPAARVLLADGRPSPAWFHPDTKIQSFGLKCNLALGFARRNSPEIHRRYGTTAAYLDVHTCVVPWHQLDHEAGQPMAAMARAKVRFDGELFQYQRDTHEGPLFGEGWRHFYWAGRCDGVEAQVAGGEDHAPFLDFDLLKLHPQMVNHGMGYYERWFRRGYDAVWGFDAGSVQQLDKYRAMELAYGHAGFLGARLVHNVNAVVREHHLMHAVQRLYGTARAVAIRYEVDGVLVTASAALALDDTRRQRIEYDSGLVVWVNWREEPWRVEGRVLPQWGFLARGPETEASTELRAGVIADYAECPEYIFADARTWFDLPAASVRKNIEPRLRDFTDLGGGRVRVTYEWVVNDALEQDFRCFVHAVNPQYAGGESIVFQQDHALSRPTSAWRKGEVVTDGPWEFTVSGKYDAYDLMIGLHKGERVCLKGVDGGANRILVARLKVVREGGRVAAVACEKAGPGAAPAEGVREADFAAHRNPPGTWVDFGKVATDGAVKVDRRPDRLVVFPYPRAREFRVSLALPPGAEAARVRLRALAAETREDLGPVPFAWDGAGRLAFTAGMPRAGRYVVAWDAR